MIAWLAGDGDAANQRFDVWVVFELPTLIARENITSEAQNLVPGTYRIRHASSKYTLSVKDGNSTDNTPLQVDEEHQKVSETLRP